MKVEVLQPDRPVGFAASANGERSDVNSFATVVDAIGKVLDGASQAEDAFASGTGTLSDAIYERARADVALSIATAAAQRGAQALQAILNMQI